MRQAQIFQRSSDDFHIGHHWSHDFAWPDNFVQSMRVLKPVMDELVRKHIQALKWGRDVDGGRSLGGENVVSRAGAYRLDPAFPLFGFDDAAGTAKRLQRLS